jgi:Tfp pilus assembly protein PilN
MIRINLLPDRRAGRKKGGGALARIRVIPLVSLGVVLVCCLAAFMVQGARLTSIEQEVATARAETQKYQQTIALITEMVQKEKELNRRLDLVKTLDKNRFRTVRVMDEVAQRIPRYMWLTSLKNVSPDRMAIDGYAFSNLVVSDLMSSLDRSEIFEDVELTVVKRQIIEGQNTVTFTVTSAINSAELGDS